MLVRRWAETVGPRLAQYALGIGGLGILCGIWMLWAVGSQLIARQAVISIPFLPIASFAVFFLVSLVLGISTIIIFQLDYYFGKP